MLSIKYYVTSQGSQVACELLYESPIDQHVPEWMDSLAQPESRHMESWAPVLGAPEYVVHVTVTVSTWVGETAVRMICQLLRDEQREAFEQQRDRHPDADTWVLESTVKTMNRVPRTDPKYVEQLQACLKNA